MAIMYWTTQEISLIINSMTPEMGSRELKVLMKDIHRSEMAINAKILEIIGIKPKSKVVEQVMSEPKYQNNKLFSGEFPNLDKNYIPSDIFASVMSNRKLKLELGDKVLFRNYDDVFRMSCFSEEIGKLSIFKGGVGSIAAVYGKSFWLKEDDSEYPIQFHVDLIRKLIKQN